MTSIPIAADNVLTEGTPVIIIGGTLRGKIGRISPLPSAPDTCAVVIDSMLYTARDIPAEQIQPLKAYVLGVIPYTARDIPAEHVYPLEVQSF